MRSPSFSMLLLAMLAVPSLLQAAEPPPLSGRPNFSGKWVLDLGRSRLTPETSEGLTRGITRIEHQEPSFSFKRAFTVAGRSDTVAFSHTTDGKETIGKEDGMPTRSSLAWSGEILVFVTIYQAPRGEARNTVKYSIRDGGKTLYAEESFRGPRVSYDNIWVFAKAD